MALMTLLPPPSHAAAGAGGGGTTSTGAGGSVGGGGGGGVVVVVVLVVVDVVVLVVEVVVDEAATRSRAASVVVARSPLLVPSSRPWNTIAVADTITMAATMNAPITHARVLNRPTLSESAPKQDGLRPGRACGHPFFGISRKGLPLLVSGSLGSPRMRSPMMFFWISSVPP
jgi:hypothetical protein